MELNLQLPTNRRENRSGTLVIFPDLWRIMWNIGLNALIISILNGIGEIQLTII